VRRRARLLAATAAVIGAGIVPGTAWAHAVLLHSVPDPSATVNVPPAKVALTYSEAVEPRFAIVSVTDASGRQRTAGSPARSPTNPDELDVPVRHLAEGWYLVYWRVVSVDGHPVRGAFTFAVGPNPGPAPQFVIPSISETAATPGLLVLRWIVFLSVMATAGLLVFRAIIARPIARRVPGSSLRAVSWTLLGALAVAIVSTPLYVLAATAKFALRSVWDVGALVPLVRASAFGRGLLQLEAILLLLSFATVVLLRVERPEARVRPVAELLALAGALLAAASALLVPGVAGHAGQTSPRGVSITLDWLHLASGSVWVGGLIGLVASFSSLGRARRLPGLAVCVPRFSRVAFVSVMLLVASGTIAAVIHLPTAHSLWQTSYGEALLVKIVLLAGAMLFAPINMLRNTPRLANAEAKPEQAESAASLLRGLVTGEIVLVAGAIFGAATLSSLPPPPKALASLGAVSASVGPGAVVRTVQQGPYRLDFSIQPNRAAVPNAFSVAISKEGKPVRGVDVTTTFTMLDMEMGQLAYKLTEASPGTYVRSEPALVMVGRWGLAFDIRPKNGTPFMVTLVDRASG
jgi:copper transport protein